MTQLTEGHESDGVRLAAIKFTEMVVLLVTSESAPTGRAVSHALLSPAAVGPSLFVMGHAFSSACTIARSAMSLKTTASYTLLKRLDGSLAKN